MVGLVYKVFFILSPSAEEDCLGDPELDLIQTLSDEGSLAIRGTSCDLNIPPIYIQRLYTPLYFTEAHLPPVGTSKGGRGKSSPPRGRVDDLDAFKTPHLNIGFDQLLLPRLETFKPHMW